MKVKVAQINYVSKYHLHCTANLNFGLMYKGWTLLGFVNKLFISVQLIFFLDRVLLLAELAQKFKLLHNSCMVKWFHETELQGIYLHIKTRTLLQNHHQPYCFLCRITYFIFQQITVRFFQIDFSSKVLLEKNPDFRFQARRRQP